ncbi:type IV toxin-antitoxin system AbiEi family antitoxin domain-containing protein [Chlorobium limicola]
MRLEQKLRSFAGVPLTHGTLLSILEEYLSPNDKIVRMIDDGLLQPIRKGLYAVSPELTGIPISLPLVANLLYGPSYVSMDYALSHYGIIPERVIEVTSMTIKRGKVYDLPVGRFSYTHAQLQLYSIGIDRVENPDQTGFLMASPEKALCDKLIFTRNLNVRSQQALHELLFDDLRIDEDALAHFNPEVIRACIAVNVKADMLQALLTLINGLQREAS